VSQPRLTEEDLTDVDQAFRPTCKKTRLEMK
jgi:hypothetical protein